ncbi:hypothetical protein ABI59_08265 [Acidobacteria bacterium Mor1]|nr:hypothetical protein ABI59_08265 [Acidobacteria bacterium Mor1]
MAETLDGFIDAVVEAHGVPGLSVAVVHEGEVVYSATRGVADTESRAPLQAGHLLHFASVSKPFVATAIMQLVEDGKLGLDDTVVSHLPYFKLQDAAAAEITIRQMLNHTSGMPDVSDYDWRNPQSGEGEAEKYVRELADESLIAPPGEQARYSNRAFDTLGDLIAKVSGQSFEDFMEARILEPLGMTHSTFFYPEIPQERRTTGHGWDYEPVALGHYPYNRRHAPSSTLNSNPPEIARWIQANLNRGELDGRRILSEAAFDELWKPGPAWGRRHVGLSWFIGEVDGQRTVAHSGGDDGFRSYLMLLPESNSGFAVVSNYSRCPTGLLRDGLTAVLLGQELPEVKRPILSEFAPLYRDQGIEQAGAFYRRVIDEQDATYAYSPDPLNDFGYYLMGREEYDRAVEVLALNVELYPDVANGYDSLGEAYLEQGNDELAGVNYARALEMDPDNDHAREVLKRLAGG